MALARSAVADDGYAAIGAGGIEFEKLEALSMDSERLFISEKEVNVRFEFKNNSTKDVVTTMAFPLPPETCGYWGENKRLEGFTALVDGKAVQVKKEIKAIENPKGGVGRGALQFVPGRARVRTLARGINRCASLAL